MEKHVNAQLRITLWPASRLPLPGTWRFIPRLDQSGDVILPAKGELEGGACETHPATLSGETYLRVCELDLEDPDEILSFVASYGALGGGLAYLDLATHETGEVDESWSGALKPPAEKAAKEAAISAEGIGLPVLRIHPGPPAMVTATGSTSLVEFEPPVVETLSEFRFAAQCIRDLTTAWDVVREGSDESWTLESVVKPLGPWTRELAGTYLSTMLSRCLKRLSPRLDAASSFSPPDALAGDVAERLRAGNYPYDRLIVEPLREPSQLPLYVLCALELFNHILEGAMYHVCANERCRRRFVHQQGRAEKGQHRSTGVRFCSPACARATAQREYRRRRLSPHSPKLEL